MGVVGAQGREFKSLFSPSVLPLVVRTFGFQLIGGSSILLGVKWKDYFIYLLWE